MGRVDGLQPGDPRQIGPFRLLGRLGEGGMGRVFLGTSPGGRKVAVKIVHPHYANDPEFLRRFAREVAAAREVGGFHTAAVVGADPDADPPWMATAYIPGRSLAEAIAERGALGEAEVRELGAALAEGLAAIHACGIIHRDLKPGNVILADDGPRIIDFGIARGADATELTASHAVIGSLRYMSPEQLNGQELTAQSDVFALGTVLAYAATGHDPFAAPTVPAVINHILNDSPDLDPLIGDLRGIIGDCLAKDPGSRPSPGDLPARFSRVEAHDPTAIATLGPDPAAAPLPPPEHVPAMVPVPEPPPADPDRPASPEPSQDSTINVAIADRQPRAAQAGDVAAPVRKPQPQRHKRAGLIAVGTTAAVALAAVVAFALDQHPPSTLSATGTRPGNSPSASLSNPADTPSATHSRSAVSPPPSRTPPASSPSATGSLSRTLSDPGLPVDSVAFAPDSTTLATGDGKGSTYLWNTRTGKITATLTQPPLGVFSVAFAPDGTTLAAGDGNGNTYLWNLKTGKITATLTQPGSGGVESVAFAPDGTVLATGDDNGETYLWNLGTGKITPTLTSPASGAVSSVAFAPDGTTLATGDVNGETCLWDLSGKLTATLTSPASGYVSSVAFAPDGTTLAIGDFNGSTYLGRTYLWNLGTGKITATLTSPASDAVYSVAFAPDGTTLATSDRNGIIYLWNLGTGKITATLTQPGSGGVDSVAFAPDGTALASGGDNGSTYLWNIEYHKS